MADKTLKVFISSTSRDLTDHREQARDACLQLDMFPKMMEYLPASASNAVEISLQMVDECDLYMGIFAHRYGYVPAGYEKSVTQMEYERAVERKMPRLIFVMHAEHLIRAENVEQGAGAIKMAAFKDRVTTENIVNFFKSPEDLRAQIVASLSHYRQESTPQAAQQAGITINQDASTSDRVQQFGVVYGDVHIHRDSPPQPAPAPAAEHKPAAPAKHIFVAFANADGGGYARRAKESLVRAGIKAQAEDDFRLNKQQAVQKAIDSAAALVVVMTRGALASREVSGQWDYALDERAIPVIVLLTPGFEPGDLPLSLRTLGFLDGRVDYDAALGQLVGEIEKI